MRWMVWMCALAMAGCGDDDGPAPDGGVDAAMVDGGDLDGGVEGDAGDEDAGTPSTLCPAGDAILDPVSGAPAFVVVSGDFSSSAVSLLALDGTVLADTWLDSGTTAPGLVSTLSGDVDVATRSIRGGVNVIDRFTTNVISSWCFDGSLVGQLRDGTFESNLQDVVVLNDGEGWVSRREENPSPDPEAMGLDRGGDLLGFDPSTMSWDGRRIDLSSLGGIVSGLDGGAEVDVQVWASPTRIVPVGDLLVVALDRIADVLGVPRGAGEGAVAVVDLADLTVSSLEFPGLRNCGSAQAIPGTGDEVVVLCQGYSDVAFADEPGVRASAGIVRLRAVDGRLEVVTRWDVSEGDRPIVTGGLVALGGDRVVAVESFPRRLLEIDLATGMSRTVFEAAADAPFPGVGQGALVGDTLLVPDTSEDVRGLRRFTVDETLVEGDSIEVGPETLAPVLVRAL
jgi:hypothetical protein